MNSKTDVFRVWKHDSCFMSSAAIMCDLGEVHGTTSEESGLIQLAGARGATGGGHRGPASSSAGWSWSCRKESGKDMHRRPSRMDGVEHLDTGFELYLSLSS